MKHRGWISFSGLLWLLIGFSLLFKGLKLLSVASVEKQQLSTYLVVGGLILGYIKGRFILVKTVRRVVSRIVSLPLPIKASQVYSKGYLLVILFMIGLGMSIRFLPVPIEIRGFVDVAIGSALMNGAMIYFRAAKALKA